MRRLSRTALFPRITAALVASALAGTSFVPLAVAQDKPAAKAPDKKTKEAARKAYGAGEKAFNAGDYAGAYEQFTKAHDLIPTPHAEYWMAAALDKQGKDAEALAAYKLFLKNPGAGKVGEDRVKESNDRVKELEAKNMGELSITTTPPGATVTIDGEPQMGETPITGLKVKPGSHKLSISAAGYKTKEVEISVTGGKAQEEKFELEAEPEVAPAPVPTPIAPEPTPEPTKPAEKPSKVPAYVTLGVAGAGAIVGTIFGIKALGSKSDYDDNPTADAADDTEQNALIADMAFGVAITLGVTGIVLLTSSGSSEPAKDGNRRLPKRARLNVAPYMSPTGGGAAARWTF